MEQIKSVCIVGSGYMGWQIALQCALHNYPVNLYDVSEQAIFQARQSISNELETLASVGKLSPEGKNATLNMIKSEPDLSNAAKNVDLIIEAVPERLEIKRNLFTELDKVSHPDTILATNSSSIRISKIEDATNRKDKVLNTHFYSTPWRSQIVELMGGTSTSTKTIELVKHFMQSIEMVPLLVRKESTGFIFNRVWRAIKRECLHLVDDGVATYEDVDRAWMCIFETEFGPFGLMDKVGLDVVRDIENVYYEESKDERDSPPKVILEKISRGELGIKTGVGFYTYPNPAYKKPQWIKDT